MDAALAADHNGDDDDDDNINEATGEDGHGVIPTESARLADFFLL